MKNCTNCGVELEDHMNYCPLCGTANNEAELADNSAAGFSTKKKGRKGLTQFQTLNDKQKRKLFWEVAGLILISGMLITFVIDVISTNTISWSKYSITVCLVLFANATLIRFTPRNLSLLMAGSLISTSLLLLLLDIFEGKIDWSLDLGLPLITLVYIVAFGLLNIIRQLKDHGLNLIAYTLLATALISVGTDILLQIHQGNGFQMSWSLIVLASILPVSALFFFIHYRLRKGTDLRRFFHI